MRQSLVVVSSLVSGLVSVLAGCAQTSDPSASAAAAPAPVVVAAPSVSASGSRIDPAESGTVMRRATLGGAAAHPEGVAVDPTNGDVFVGSSADGNVYRIKQGTREAVLYHAGGDPGRTAAFGLKVDSYRRLWIAGGPTRSLAVIELDDASLKTVFRVPPAEQTFVKDLVFAGPHVYVTDASRPVIYRLSPGLHNPVLLPWLDLATTPIRYRPNQTNLSGIVASPDGRWLLAIQAVTGQLWRIDIQRGEVQEVKLSRGSLQHAEGLVLKGPRELYVVRRDDNEVVRVELDADWTRGNPTHRLVDAELRHPSAAALTADGLWVVNSQNSRRKPSTPVLPFEMVKIDLPD
ncbi:MAG: hypothetical protein RLZZ618_2083 [Pseudomonadota bacterium]|jgi:Cu-Zn family superoxide dismutase